MHIAQHSVTIYYIKSSTYVQSLMVYFLTIYSSRLGSAANFKFQMKIIAMDFISLQKALTPEHWRIQENIRSSL